MARGVGSNRREGQRARKGVLGTGGERGRGVADVGDTAAPRRHAELACRLAMQRDAPALHVRADVSALAAALGRLHAQCLLRVPQD